MDKIQRYLLRGIRLARNYLVRAHMLRARLEQTLQGALRLLRLPSGKMHGAVYLTELFYNKQTGGGVTGHIESPTECADRTKPGWRRRLDERRNYYGGTE